MFRIAPAAGERHIGNCGDARERFTAKPEARNTFEILESCNLARGVTCECERQVAFADAEAIIADFEQPGAAARELHADVQRAGVEAVFEQFLECRRGALDNFAGGDLVDQKIG